MTSATHSKTLQRIAGVAFRVYVVAIIVAILTSGGAWVTGELAIFSGVIGLLWYGIAGFGTILFVLLLAVHRLTPEE